MAAPMESSAFCQIVNEPSLIDISVGHIHDSVIVTSKQKSCNIYKLSDQKLIKSWSLRHGITVTSAVVWDDTQETFLCVTNHKDVHSWEKDTNEFEKSKKKHSKSNIHELMLARDYEPVLLYENGCVDVLSNIKKDHNTGTLSGTDKIQWCTTAIIQSQLHVLYLANTKSGVILFVFIYDVEASSWRQTKSQMTPASLGETTISSCDYSHTDHDMNITLLWSSGELTAVQVTDGDIRTPHCSHTIPGLHRNASIATLDDLHIAVAPVTRDKQAGVCIFDIKFGLQKAWQAFTEKPQCKPKIFVVDKRLFIPSHTTLYTYKFECEPSTVVSLLGHIALDTQQTVPSHFHWNTQKKSENLTPPESSLSDLFKQALDKTKDYSLFKDVFSKLFVELKKKENNHWLMSSHMTKFVQCLLKEFNVWPKQEIEQLISIRCVPPGVLEELLGCLIKRSEVTMVYTLLSTLINIPEKCLCTAVSFFLECEEEKLPCVSELAHTVDHNDIDETDSDMDGDSLENNAYQDNHGNTEKQCPISDNRAHLVNKVLCMPYSDVFLLECLRKISFKDALKLLEYLSHLLESRSALQMQHYDSDTQLSLVKVVDWLCLVLDAHITQFVLSPDCHVTIVKLNSIVTQRAQFFDSMGVLEALLEQFKARGSLPQDKKIGHYCIEVLHVF